MELDEDIRDFLIESNESLANLDRDIVQLEQNPGDLRVVSSAFRAIHTIKGTSGFFGFARLGALTHVTENLLSQIRSGQRKLTPELITLLLEAIDEVKSLLSCIESTGQEGENDSAHLRDRLERAHLEGLEANPESAEFSAAPPAKRPRSGGGYQRLQAPSPPDIAAEPATPSVPDARKESEMQMAPEEKQESRVAEATSQLTDSTIRVDVGLLNRLMNLVGELVLARNQLLQETSASSSLQQTSQRLNLITSELQESVMKTRMQPIGVVWNKLPRVVRDLAAQCGKTIRIEMEGADTELDKTIIEAIKDPLTHIVRNCCDHGIEPPERRLEKGKKAEGLISLRAYHEGGVVNIEVSDDGSGIDLERVKAKAIGKGMLGPEKAAQLSQRDTLNLIFLPGFSTAAQVTAVSGRGVGMDVVKNNIERIGGSVEVLNRAEGGAKMRIKIPLTLAIIPGLVVTLNRKEDGAPEAERPRRGWRLDERFIIPQANLLELVRIQAAERAKRIENVHGTPVLHHRGKLLPLVYLGQVLQRPEAEAEASDVVNIVVLQAENRKVGLVVDRICDTQEIVVKPLGRQLKGLSCYVGATIMGDGRTSLILDVVGLARLAGLGAQVRPVAQTEAPVPTNRVERSQKLLLFRAGSCERMAVPLALVDRLEEIETRAIRHAAGRLVLHYRDGILPLVTLPELLEPGTERGPFLQSTLQVIVFTDGVRRMGLIVDEILDIVDEVIAARRSVTAPGILGSAVVGGHITDLLDLHALLTATGDDWLGRAPDPLAATSRLLVVEGRFAAREMLQTLLETEGYNALCVSSIEEALKRLKQESFQLVIIPFDVAGERSAGVELARSLRKDAPGPHVPILGLAEPHVGSKAAMPPEVLDAFDAYVCQGERGALISKIAELLAMLQPAAAMEVLL